MKTNSHHHAAVYDRRKYLLEQPLPLCVPCVLSRLTWLFLFGFLAFSVSAQVQQAWVARYSNGILNGTNQAVKMALDSAGNIYITGFSQNTNGNLDYATIKYSPNGTQVWATRFDSTNTTYAAPTAIILDSNNDVIVTGSSVTVKYDPGGNQIWTAPYSGSSAAVAVDAADNVYVTGFGASFNVEKLSSKGSNVWQTTYVDIGPTLSQAVLVDTQTNIYVAGSDTYTSYSQGGVIKGYYAELAVLKYDLNGTQLWKAVYAAVLDEVFVQIAGAAFDTLGNFCVIAEFNPGDNGYLRLLRYNAAGSLISTAFSPNNCASAVPKGLALDKFWNMFLSAKACYLAPDGSYATFQYGTYKSTTNGAWVWTNVYPSVPVQPSAPSAIAVDQANNIYVTGFSPRTNSGNNIVTIKYDNNGNQIWVQRYNGPGNGDDEANAIAVDASGNVYVTGYETTAAGGTEMVTIKYAPSPTGSKQTTGTFLLQTQGEPGETFDIQATTNFKSWLDLGLTNADTNGLLQFLDTNANLFNQRYYITKPQ